MNFFRGLLRALLWSLPIWGLSVLVYIGIARGEQLIIIHPTKVNPQWDQTYDKDGIPDPEPQEVLDYKAALSAKVATEVKLKDWKPQGPYRSILGNGLRITKDGKLYELHAFHPGQIKAPGKTLIDCPWKVVEDVGKWLKDNGYSIVDTEK